MIKLKYTIYSFILVFSLIILGSCMTFDLVTVEQLQPAEIFFPEQIRKVAIVNNPVADEPEEKPGEQIIINGNSKLAAESLAEQIANENYFDQVTIRDSVLYNKNKTILSQQEVTELCEELDADMIISLEALTLLISPKMILPQNSYYYTYILDAYVTPEIRMYIPEKSTPIFLISATDSIFWESYGITETNARNAMITREQLVNEASQFAGTIPTKYFLPSWESANRILYTSGSAEMRDAIVYVKQGNWDKAGELWEKSYEKLKGKKKMRAAYNTAIYYEVKDNIEKAESWFSKAKELSGYKEEESDIIRTQDQYILLYFQDQLKKRKEQIPKLNIQMNRFNDDFE